MKHSPLSAWSTTKAAKNPANQALFPEGAGKVSSVQEKGAGSERKRASSSGLANLQASGRLKAGEMNQTERRYFDKLTFEKQAGKVAWFAFEPVNLRLADKCFYKVDFLVMTDKGELEVHEVKGFWTDDALVKIKVAAELFPFRFIAVKYVKGEWEIREF